MLSHAVNLLENATQAFHEDPATALRLARQALRVSPLRCLRIRCAVVAGNALSVLGNLDRSDRIFRAAYGVAGECRCCAPIVDRNMAKLLSKRGDLCEALSRLTPVSVNHRAAQFNMLDALAQSKTEANLERVFALLPQIEQSFKGLRDVSMQRAHFAWLTGQVKASLTQFRPADGWSLINEASDSLAAGCRKFRLLKLPTYHAACWADWAAVQYMKARLFDRARVSFSDRLSWVPARRDQRVPPPFGSFTNSAAPILTGDPSPLLTFRQATEQGDPLLPYP
jgi:hypothetical protein